jgi:site-specific DNA-methyltransferase (adenine-specific)
MLNEGLFTSRTDEWATPQKLFDELNQEYQFTLDPCATPENAKCPQYFTKEQDGLNQKWPGRVFMNPPYGREIGKWVAKAWVESVTTAEIVVCLLPARTDTKWFHEYCFKEGEVRFLQGRLKFGDSKNSAPFPSAIVIFDFVMRRDRQLIKYDD